MTEKRDAHSRGKYSREKGKRFERELAKKFQENGFDARRSVQYNGLSGDADVIGVPKIHVEAKAVEKLNIYEAMEQAVRDTKNEEFPTVFQKRNGKGILVTMRFDDWIELYRGWLK